MDLYFLASIPSAYTNGKGHDNKLNKDVQFNLANKLKREELIQVQQ